MALDAGMVGCIRHELNARTADARVDKIYQPSKDDIVLLLRAREGNLRLLLSCAAGVSRACITGGKYENPVKAPMFCMLLRKHLSGSKIVSVTQPGFERVLFFTFAAFDDMGFPCEKYIVLELIGKFSNLIFLDNNKKIIAAIKNVDISESPERAVLPGLQYEMPPRQDKTDPLTVTRADFDKIMQSGSGGADKLIVSSFLGISPLVAREIVFLSSHDTGKDVSECDTDRLWYYFSAFVRRVKENDYAPTLVFTKDGEAREYSFMPITQYGALCPTREYGGASALIEAFYSVRAEQSSIKTRSADILRLLSAAQSRLERKISAQTEELSECEKMDEYKLYGDLLTANLYMIKSRAEEVSVPNYYSENCESITVPLNPRLTPAANAQYYYKKYNKLKNARRELSRQIGLARNDLEYIDTVFDALCRARTGTELDEIREELYSAGFASRMKGYSKKKHSPSGPLEFKSSGGFKILCGRNNVQNDRLTLRTADKRDYWFHVKNAPGSHVILCCAGKEPADKDITDAALIAAYNSRLSGGTGVAVDYTPVKFVKKPAGAKPGYVIYSTNRTAYVSPSKNDIERLTP